MRLNRPILSLKERDRRWALAKELMIDQKVDCIIATPGPDIDSFDGWFTNDSAGGIVIFPLSDEPSYLVWAVSAIWRSQENAKNGIEPWVKDWQVGSKEKLVELLTKKGLGSARIGVLGLVHKGPGSSRAISYEMWSYVTEQLPKATFVDILRPLAERIMPKSEEERALARYCAHVGELACQAMLEVVKSGTSESEVYAEVISTILKNGVGVPYPSLILHSGKDNLSSGAPIWLYQAQNPPKLKKGELIQAELFPMYGGLHTQQQMTIAIEPLEPFIKELGGIARASYDVGMQFIKPGKTFKEVYDAMKEPIEEAGCWHQNPMIHSLNPYIVITPMFVGVENVPEIEKREGVTTALGSNMDIILKPGMTCMLEPNACRGKCKITIGGTILITEDGIEPLNKLCTRLHIAE